MTETILLTNGRVLDAASGTRRDGLDVLVRDGRIADVATGIAAPADATSIDLGGRTLMPGLIDCHVHVVAESLDLWSNMTAPSSLAGLRSARVMEEIYHEDAKRAVPLIPSSAPRLPSA